MKNEIKIMTRIMLEDNKLHVRLNQIFDLGIEIEGVSNDLFKVIANILEIPADDLDNASDEYYAFIEYSRTYAECEAFLTEWKKELDGFEAIRGRTIAPETI